MFTKQKSDDVVLKNYTVEKKRKLKKNPLIIHCDEINLSTIELDDCVLLMDASLKVTRA